MINPPAVAKTTWTEADFATMSWHDVAIHAIAVEELPDEPGRLLLDLDYIVAGVRPEPAATRLNFWICPATLVFDPAWDLTVDADFNGWGFQWFLRGITRSGPDERGNSEWTLAGDRCTIEIGSPGFTQYLRRPPVLSKGHWLSVEDRGGFSFAREAYQP
jgi:hypothetical protein